MILSEKPEKTSKEAGTVSWVERWILQKMSFKHSPYILLYICWENPDIKNSKQRILIFDLFLIILILWQTPGNLVGEIAYLNLSCTRDILPTMGLLGSWKSRNKSHWESPSLGFLPEEKDKSVSNHSNLWLWHWSPMSLNRKWETWVSRTLAFMTRSTWRFTPHDRIHLKATSCTVISDDGPWPQKGFYPYIINSV